MGFQIFEFHSDLSFFLVWLFMPCCKEVKCSTSHQVSNHFWFHYCKLYSCLVHWYHPCNVNIMILLSVFLRLFPCSATVGHGFRKISKNLRQMVSVFVEVPSRWTYETSGGHPDSWIPVLLVCCCWFFGLLFATVAQELRDIQQKKSTEKQLEETKGRIVSKVFQGWHWGMGMWLKSFDKLTLVIHQCHHDVWKGVSTVLPYIEMTSVDAIRQRECCVAKFQQEQLAAKEAEIAELKEIQFLADTILPSIGCLRFVVVVLLNLVLGPNPCFCMLW